jgi:hypothetical protein
MKHIIAKLPIVKQILEMKRELSLIRYQADRQTRIQQEIYFQQLKSSSKYSDSRHLIHFESQVYSQNGEDGIISEIFKRIGYTNKFFVEMGTSTGLENNTLLVLEGWKGVWIEGNEDANRQALNNWVEYVSSGQLKVVTSLITAENFQQLLYSNNVPSDLDLLSLDIDRNTLYALEQLNDFRPRVIVVEYNGIFPVNSSWVIDYQANEGWDGTHRYGAALKKFETVAKQKGYQLIGCESTGTNAFFVREDIIQDHFVGPFTTEFHYEPYRQFLVREMLYPKV